jgi:transcriptional regulator with XRE-family HTH domain
VYQLLGAKIAEKRGSHKMTQSELAIRCGLKRPSIVLIEQGKQHIPIDGLYRLARELQCEINDLLPPVQTVFESLKESSSQEFQYDAPSRSKLTDPYELAQLESVLREVDRKNETTS